MSKTKKEKEISELVLARKLVQGRIDNRRKLQEQCRRELKLYENYNEEDDYLIGYVKKLGQDIFENKVILNALQEQSLNIRKKIRRLNKEQVIRNKQNN